MKTILIIDDEGAYRRSLVRQMHCLKEYQVIQAGNGLEAIKVLEEQPVDIVITDILMPEKEGLSVITDLQQTHPELPVIAISSCVHITGINYLEFALELGAKAVFEKPFDCESLIGKIKELTAG